MAYDHLRTAAFVPNPEVAEYHDLWQAFTLPQHWRDAVQDVVRIAWNKSGTYDYIPVSRFNRVVEAVVPDLVHVASNAHDLNQPWFYTKHPVPTNIMRRLLLEWLKDIASGAEIGNRQIQECFRQFDVAGSRELWEPAPVNLWEQELSEGGTAQPAKRLHRLLPDVIADRIARQTPYEFQGQRVEFLPTATDRGAELMAWPPLKHGSDKKPYYFSPVIRVRLHTVPFSPVPRLYLNAGIRRWYRWKAGKQNNQSMFRIPERQGVSVYLRPDHPWIDDTDAPRRMSRAMIDWNNRQREVSWRFGGPGEMFARLGAASRFPDLTELRKDSYAYLDIRDGTQAVVTHGNAMSGKHNVQLGFSPTERLRLLEWAGRALEPEYVQMGDLGRAVRNDKPVFQVPKVQRTFPTVEIPVAPDHDDAETLVKYTKELAAAEKKLQAQQRAKDKAARNAEAAAEAWRLLLSEATDCDEVRIHLLYESDEVREAIVTAARECLDADCDVTEDPATGRFDYYLDAETVAVRIHARPRGGLGQPLLTGGLTPTAGRVHDAAKQQRAEDTERHLASLDEDSELVFVELPNRADFVDDFGRKAGLRDPKQAIRRGAAMAGKVTQFITPPQIDDDQEDAVDGSLSSRAKSSWEDGLRAIGVRFIAQHTVGDAIPKELNQVAFWLIKKNKTSLNKRDQYTPVAVLIRPGSRRIMAKTPDMTGWCTYPEVLRHVALMSERGEEADSETKQKHIYARFIRATLSDLRNEPTLVLMAADNSRQRWDWLQDGKVQADKLQLGSGPVQRLSLFGSKLRVVRVRQDCGNYETPDWWAPDHAEDTKWEDREAGLTSGLWRQVDDSDRVYYSVAEKNENLSKADRRTSKMSAWISGTGKLRGPQAQANLPQPTLVEIAVTGLQDADHPQDWALFAHQQRFVSEHRNGLGWPLALKLAEDIGDYAYPAAEEELPEEDAAFSDQPELDGFSELSDVS